MNKAKTWGGPRQAGTGKRMGRPALPAAEKKRGVHLTLPPETLEFWKSQAQTECVSLSRLMKIVLEAARDCYPE